MTVLTASNLNHLWGNLIIEELRRCGVESFCIAPGSRSSPLTAAAARNKKIKTIVHFDERGLAFYALGYTSVTKKPCVLISTSGTAVANFFPAVIEASKRKLSLIVLTADRPPELRFTGSDQTIDQVKIFGSYVRFAFDLPVPTTEIAPEMVLTTVDQAVYQSKGRPPGPVHLNCMFREPLAQKGDRLLFEKSSLSPLKNLKKWMTSGLPWTTYGQPQATLSEKDIKTAAQTVRGIKNGLIAVGKLSTQDEREAVCKLARKLNWPVFPDITSGLRMNQDYPNIIHYFDQLLLSDKLTNRWKCDGVIQIGGRMTSKRYAQWIEQTQPQKYLMILNHPLRNDPSHSVTLRLEAPAGAACTQLARALKKRPMTPVLALLRHASNQVDDTLRKAITRDNQLSEIAAARIVSEKLRSGHGLFLASSMPIRDVDMYSTRVTKNVSIGSNRGVSGIDGTIASACGFAAGLNKPTTLLIGDLAFLHDVNSLALLKNLKQPLVCVVINNDGGGIFSFLPVAQVKDVFTKYFAAPHGLNFESAARLFKLNYAQPKTQAEFVSNYQAAVKNSKSTVIEVTTDRGKNHKRHVLLQREIKKTLDTKV